MKARRLETNEELGLELEATVSAFDSTTSDRGLSWFLWAQFRKRKGAIKRHTLPDLRGVSTGLASRSSLQLAPPWGFGPKTISAFLATPLDPGQIRPEFAAIRRDAWPCLDRGQDDPERLRSVRCFDAERRTSRVFLTHNFTFPAPSVASLYPLRWQRERFFQGERSAASRRAASGRGRPRLLSEKKRALSEARRAPISGRLDGRSFLPCLGSAAS